MSNPVYNYVRRIDNNNEILMSGYSDFTGQFDELVYEQITGFPPTDSTIERSLSLTAGLFGMFLTLPVLYRVSLYPIVTAINHAIINGDIEGATELLVNTPVPNELIEIKNNALYYFNIINIIDNEITFSDSVQDIVES